MFGLIVVVVLGLVALVGLVGAILTRSAEDRSPFRGAVAVTVIAVLVGGIIGFFTFTTSVNANNVGIVTAWGKWSGTMEPGRHTVAPWASVEQFSTRVQVTDRKAGPEGDVPGADCVQVNLKGGAGACADLTLRYVVNSGDVQDLWKRYGSFDVARDKLLRSATDNAAKVVYGQLDPQAAISGDAIPNITTKMTDELGKQLNASGLTLVAVAPGQLHLSKDVQARIDSILNAQTDTAVAEQNKTKNEKQAAANQALTNSLTPEILTQQCLETAKVVKPQVLACLPGAPTPPVILGAKGQG